MLIISFVDLYKQNKTHIRETKHEWAPTFWAQLKRNISEVFVCVCLSTDAVEIYHRRKFGLIKNSLCSDIVKQDSILDASKSVQYDMQTLYKRICRSLMCEYL